MKLDRLIAILSVLLNQEQSTAPELAKRFEVSRRTINRDIEALNQAGIPIGFPDGSHCPDFPGNAGHSLRSEEPGQRQWYRSVPAADGEDQSRFFRASSRRPAHPDRPRFLA